jgi:Fe-S cluster assembly protein SufD
VPDGADLQRKARPAGTRPENDKNMTLDYLKEQLDQLPSTGNKGLSGIRRGALEAFMQQGIPTGRDEEWKYTRIAQVFNKEYRLEMPDGEASFAAADMSAIRLPGYESANELVFVNGRFSEELSVIRSEGLKVMPLEEVETEEHRSFLGLHFNHSSGYLKDGIHALNTAWMLNGAYIYIEKKATLEHPVYIYNVSDSRRFPVISQPRSLVQVSEGAQAQLVETYFTLGDTGSFTNQVMEIVVEKDAHLTYYKIQNDKSTASQVSTTHIRQTGKSAVSAVTVSLEGGIVRNNLHAVMEAPYAEAHLYGLYFQSGESHIDNHTLVDNAVPNCLSNELYKGILDQRSTGVFNGKVFVRKDAQKTNAFQSNKNVLLSETAGINTKPQLEIFADDVKCSHGCTIGSLDEEGLFYLQSRGIPYGEAVALLLQGFASDILEKIQLVPVRDYVQELIAQRLKKGKRP